MKIEKTQRQRASWRQALGPSLAAGFFILISFSIIQQSQSGLFIAAFGASAYIVFALPDSAPARSRALLGGHGSALVCSLFCLALRQWQPLFGVGWAVVGWCAVAVFLTVFAMKASGLEHPPAVALTISLMLAANPYGMALVAVLLMLGLCGCKLALAWARAWLAVRRPSPQSLAEPLAEPAAEADAPKRYSSTA